MNSKKIVISGTGCALGDFLYNGVSFESDRFKKYLSRKSGDGGLSPGKLVFTDELEKFSGKPYPEILKDIIGNELHDAFNVGGPSIVPLIHLSQMLDTKEFEVRFFGMSGKDEIADQIKAIVRKTPLDITNYLITDKHVTSFTDVLSDPAFENYHGERTFINNIGAAWDYHPQYLNDSFFNSNIVCFGGTALVPNIHDKLTDLLTRAKEENCITVVNTVYDFRNEKRNPGNPWPLVKDIESYGMIDILMMDYEEALKISGEKTMEKAADFFASTKVSSFLITNGAKTLFAWSSGRLFEKSKILQLPVSKKVTEDINIDTSKKGDTTGCGDNFSGGVVASVAWQLKRLSAGKLNFIEAISWGVASGGFCCFTVGGTYIEKHKGEKKQMILALQQEYLKQIGN
jgi:sugar/nucleoside kinase (ribokinase family)